MRIIRKIKIEENKDASERRLREHADQSPEETFQSLRSGKEGLTKREAAKRLEKNGENIIKVDNESNVFTRLKAAVINPFNLVLAAIAIITYFTDVFFSDSDNYLTVGMVLFLIIVSSLIAFVQGERSNSVASKLSKLITNKVDVFRSGKIIEAAIETLVLGDVIKLSAGDMIPADIKFIETRDTFIAQAALTGESQPVEKFSEIKDRNVYSLTDLSNIGFMGTNVISGSALAVVVATGNDTYFGSMAKTLTSSRAKNSFEKGVDSVSRLLIQFMLIMVPLILIINGFTKNDWFLSFLFAISIAVGLTPEMLPVIMTSTLAKGAVLLSKLNVVVKDLGSIQVFGEMDVLCTDKTGTLTEDKVILEKYMNLNGDDDTKILESAFLNSYFQTGLKNLLDLAIINRAKENKLSELTSNYTLVDEMPFDFERRRMSVVLEDKKGKKQVITKGAVEEILSICSHAEYNGKIIKLDKEAKKRAMDVYHKYNSEGLRMIALAQTDRVLENYDLTTKDEKDMLLIGFVGFLDPPKESAKTAVTALSDHGVRMVVLTGDSQGVALKVCDKVGLDAANPLQGRDVEKMNDEELKEAVRTCSLFSKLSPIQKQRIVNALQQNGHTVGYLGDGINDAPALRQADVGISVDTAVDIAKETANIILLKKDLMVLEQGVIEGRRTFGNVIKYIKMATSGNFGNMFSVLVASIFLPFLPMLPIHILVQNLLCDFSQIGMPFDKVDKEYIKKPRKWETKSIKSFMWFMGPLSSIFDILTFVVLFFVIKANIAELAPLFQAGWFVFGTVSQILVIHMIRTSKIPFIQSSASVPLFITTIGAAAITLFIGFTAIAPAFELTTLPLIFVPYLIILLLAYCLSTQLIKKIYIAKYGEWL